MREEDKKVLEEVKKLCSDVRYRVILKIMEIGDNFNLEIVDSSFLKESIARKEDIDDFVESFSEFYDEDEDEDEDENEDLMVDIYSVDMKKMLSYDYTPLLTSQLYLSITEDKYLKYDSNIEIEYDELDDSEDYEEDYDDDDFNDY